MAVYRTEQKKMLLAYLQANGGEAYTVDELVDGMAAVYGEMVPGTSTVYRLITRMVEEGSVKRFVRDKGRGFVYQIVVGRSCHAHLHMRCTACGRLFHAGELLSEELGQKLAEQCRFSLNTEQTVLFGLCDGCQKG